MRLFGAPRRPHTKSLLSAVPRIGEGRVTDHFVLEGEPSDPGRHPGGRRFRERRPRDEGGCAEREPVLEVGEGEQGAACHFG